MTAARLLYTPNEAVVDAHNIPHLITSDGGLQKGPDQFSLTAGTSLFSTTGYLFALLPFPIIVTGAGVLAILIYQTLLCFRCCRCCKCLKCAPTEEQASEHPKDVVTKRRRLLAAFIFFLFTSLLALHALWIANSNLDEGIALIGASVNSLNNIFLGMTSSGTQMQSDFSKIQEQVDDNANCFVNHDIAKGYAEGGQQAGNGIVDLSSPVTPLLASAAANIVTNGQAYKLYVISLVYALGMVLVVGLALGVWLRRKLLVWFLIFLTELVVLVSTLVSCVEMLLAMTVGDFCMDPITYLTSLTTSTSVIQIINFYGRCDASSISPFASDVKSLVNSTNYFTSGTNQKAAFVQPETPACTAVVARVKRLSSDATSQLSAVTESFTECDAIFTVIDQLLNQGVCGKGFSGFFQLLVAQYIASLSLFAAVLVVCVLYQYFERIFWNLQSGDDDPTNTDADAEAAEGVPVNDSDSDDTPPSSPGKKSAHNAGDSFQYPYSRESADLEMRRYDNPINSFKAVKNGKSNTTNTYNANASSFSSSPDPNSESRRKPNTNAMPAFANSAHVNTSALNRPYANTSTNSFINPDPLSRYPKAGPSVL